MSKETLMINEEDSEAAAGQLSDSDAYPCSLAIEIRLYMFFIRERASGTIWSRACYEPVNS